MSKVQVISYGGGNPNRPFEAIAGDLEEAVDMEMLQAAEDVQERAVRHITASAYLTGLLSTTPEIRKLAPMKYEVFSDLYYAIYVHDGTRFMAARPFFTWATQEARPAMIQGLKFIFSLNKYGGRGAR